jgi:tetratricopeptide (TPR) repeat protein
MRRRPRRTERTPGRLNTTGFAAPLANPHNYRMRILVSVCLLAATASARTEFWAPLEPPRARYSINVSYSQATQRLEGTETIRFRNDTRRPIGRIALQWFGDVLHVRANGTTAERSPGEQDIALFDLPADIAPGGRIELAVDFGASWILSEKSGGAIASSLNPRVWWGFGTHDDYEVRVRAPEGYAIATSGRFDPGTRAYRADGIRAFGLFIGKGYKSAEADAGDVHVRAVFTAKGQPCAELLLKTAVDAIGFYRQRFGLYPQRSLAIVPGMDYPAGGYPAATGLVVIHGQERLPERPEAFWRWITAHEIGHQYWSEEVLGQGPDGLSWLTIGLGIHMDREYRKARGITDAVALESDYIDGVRQGLDTTMDVTAEEQAAIKWDFNNVVEHGKSAALMNALESVIGVETFDRAYGRCLRAYAGRRLGWRDFQRVCEAESGQDLDWFFEQWVRSSKSADYRIVSRDCSPANETFVCTVRIERLGAMRVPVTVAARFEDGSEQRARTERLARIDELTFRAKSRLKEAIVDPDSAVAMAEAPSAADRELGTKVRDLPWTGAGESALAAYRQARDSKLEDSSILLKLSLTLYDGRYYQEALDVLAKLERSGPAEVRFTALVWQGHVLDVLGRRAEALGRYEEALRVPGSPSMQHSQYNLTINRQWVEDRLKSPFERK